jgi:hypothetical protein
MPLKDKSMSIIRIRPLNSYSLQSLFEDIFYRDKTGNLVNSAILLYEKIRKDPAKGLRSSEWQNHVSDIFKIESIQFDENNALKELSQKYESILKAGESKRGLRGKKPYQALLDKHSKGDIKLNEKEHSLLQRVSNWYSAVSSYYSILNKLKAIGMIEKKEGNYVISKKFVSSLSSIEKALKYRS